jgi:hypothetical protein
MHVATEIDVEAHRVAIMDAQDLGAVLVQGVLSRR